jgi:hypothetical protein
VFGLLGFKVNHAKFSFQKALKRPRPGLLYFSPVLNIVVIIVLLGKQKQLPSHCQFERESSTISTKSH